MFHGEREGVDSALRRLRTCQPDRHDGLLAAAPISSNDRTMARNIRALWPECPARISPDGSGDSGQARTCSSPSPIRRFSLRVHGAERNRIATDLALHTLEAPFSGKIGKRRTSRGSNSLEPVVYPCRVHSGAKHYFDCTRCVGSSSQLRTHVIGSLLLSSTGFPIRKRLPLPLTA